jgi:DNA-binding IclR family transcriptional regulator
MMNWPNKTQRRVLRELAEVTRPGGDSFPEERLAKRLDMPVEEVRRHLQVLADIGMVEEAP